ANSACAGNSARQVAPKPTQVRHVRASSPRPPQNGAMRPIGLAILAALLFALPAGAPAAQRASAPAIAPEQQLVTLLSVKSVHAEPVVGRPAVAAIVEQRPLTRVRTP